MAKKTQKQTDAERMELLRIAARADFRSYVRYTMPNYRENWHHRVLIDHLQLLADGKIEKLLVTAPPRHGKSELISRRFPAWLVGGYWGAAMVLSASHTQDLADKMGRDVQRILRDPRHRQVFPDFGFGEKETAREFDTVAGGGYKAAGVGGAIAGRGANFVLIDDPVSNREGAESATQRDKTAEWFYDDVLTRLEPPGGLCVTATRWHKDDLSGRILEGSDAAEWVHIHLPAILDSDPPPWPGDPRQLGDPLWPSRYLNPRAGETLENTPAEVLRARALRWLEGQRARTAYGFEALYQGNPSLKEGALFTRGADRQFMGDPRQVADTCDFQVISVDATFGASKKGDAVSIVVGGGRGPHRFVFEELTKRMTYPETKLALLEMARKWPNASVLIELKANGQALVDDLRGTLPRVIGFIPQASKEARAQVAAEVWNSGQMFLPGAQYMPTKAEFLEDFYGFGSRAHDDRVDAVSQFIIHYAGRNDALAHLRRITDGFMDHEEMRLWGRR
jgi:predicted phage terminase large subunit-like protein